MLTTLSKYFCSDPSSSLLSCGQLVLGSLLHVDLHIIDTWLAVPVAARVRVKLCSVLHSFAYRSGQLKCVTVDEEVHCSSFFSLLDACPVYVTGKHLLLMT